MYMFHCPDALRLSFPILVDPNGLFVRRHGLDGNFMCSWTPKTNEQEPDPNDKLGNEAFFNDVLWPKLAFRVPAFKKLTVSIYIFRVLAFSCLARIIEFVELAVETNVAID